MVPRHTALCTNSRPAFESSSRGHAAAKHSLARPYAETLPINWSPTVSAETTALAAALHEIGAGDAARLNDLMPPDWM